MKTSKLKPKRDGRVRSSDLVRCAFTASEACHILSLIACNERNGEHTAPQDQYWKRSERIKAKLTPNAQAERPSGSAPVPGSAQP